MKLFKWQTISHFRIGQWLEKQGVKPEHISFAEFPDKDTVKITNSAGQSLIIRLAGSRTEIDAVPE